MSKGKDLINSIKYGLYRMLTMQLFCLAMLFLLISVFLPNLTPFSLAILLPSWVLS